MFDLSSKQNQKPFEKKFATLAATAVFESLFFQKQQIYHFLAGNNYPDLPHLQGGIKFAKQISPLLNYFVKNMTMTMTMTVSVMTIWPSPLMTPPPLVARTTFIDI